MAKSNTYVSEMRLKFSITKQLHISNLAFICFPQIVEIYSQEK